MKILVMSDLHLETGPLPLVEAGSVVLSHLPPLRTRVLRRLPALSSLRGYRQAQDSKWPDVAKRDMSMPISATITCALTSLRSGQPSGSVTSISFTTR